MLHRQSAKNVRFVVIRGRSEREKPGNAYSGLRYF